MELWGTLIAGSLVWASIIAGLIYVVRDCMKDQHHEPTFLDYGEEECQGCSGLGTMEILTHKCQEP